MSKAKENIQMSNIQVSLQCLGKKRKLSDIATIITRQRILREIIGSETEHYFCHITPLKNHLH